MFKSGVKGYYVFCFGFIDVQNIDGFVGEIYFVHPFQNWLHLLSAHFFIKVNYNLISITLVKEPTNSFNNTSCQFGGFVFCKPIESIEDAIVLKTKCACHVSVVMV